MAEIDRTEQRTADQGCRPWCADHGVGCTGPVHGTALVDVDSSAAGITGKIILVGASDDDDNGQPFVQLTACAEQRAAWVNLSPDTAIALAAELTRLAALVQQ